MKKKGLSTSRGGDDERKGDEEMGALPPEIRIVSRRGQWIGTDQLPINRFSENSASDYRLVWLSDSITQSFFIVSPFDIVAALPRTSEDHIKWLWERKQFELAWREAIKHEKELARSKLKASDLGEAFLKWTLKNDRYLRFSLSFLIFHGGNFA